MLDIFSVAVVLIRGLALLVVAIALPALPGMLTAIKQGYDQERYFSFAADPYVGPMVIAWLGQVALAILFLVFVKRLARFLRRGLENTNLQIDETSLSLLQRVAFSVLGASLVMYAVPALIKMAAIGFLDATRDSAEARHGTASPRLLSRWPSGWRWVCGCSSARDR